MKNIVLAGGPCSGKTDVLSYIKKNGLNIGFDKVVCVSEMAENILRHNPTIRHDPWNFQIAVFYAQLQTEEMYRSTYENTKTLIVYDRGLADAKVYLGDLFGLFETDNSMSYDEMLKRYDAVYLLESAVSSSLYRKTDIRTESTKEADFLNAKAIETWSKHPRCYFIEATDTPEGKVMNVVNTISCTFKDWI